MSVTNNPSSPGSSVAKCYSDRPAIKNSLSRGHKVVGRIEKAIVSTIAPIVIGIYGLPGSGKTFLLDQLKSQLNPQHFSFYDGSAVLSSVVPGGLLAFSLMEEQHKPSWRQMAIRKIHDESLRYSKIAIVAGHRLFWDDNETTNFVHTQWDLEIFTHIIYLDFNPEVIAQRQVRDTKKKRRLTSTAHIEKWQQLERSTLRSTCREHGIFFTTISSPFDLLPTVLLLIQCFQLQDEKQNLSTVTQKLDDAILAAGGNAEAFLVFDADKTLSAQDATAHFWTKDPNLKRITDKKCPLKELFSSPWGYSFEAYYQAALLYEETGSQTEFEVACHQAADEVVMRPEFVSLLQATKKGEIQAVVITCGLRTVWEKILKRHKLSSSVIVIGSGPISNGYVVDAQVKGS